jgi:hypothetical protein
LTRLETVKQIALAEIGLSLENDDLGRTGIVERPVIKVEHPDERPGIGSSPRGIEPDEGVVMAGAPLRGRRHSRPSKLCLG